MNSLAQSIVNFLFPTHCFVCKKSDVVLCDKCLHAMHPPLDTPHHFISARYSYKDKRMKKIIHAIKFFHRKDLIRPLSRELLPLLPHINGNLVLVPVPMPRFRRLLRGYNQSELLAHTLSSLSGIPVDTSILIRRTSPARQVTTHNRKERLRNQKNTFITYKDLTGREIIIIDDVTTTGATLSEAKKVLDRAGASKVHAITIAH